MGPSTIRSIPSAACAEAAPAAAMPARSEHERSVQLGHIASGVGTRKRYENVVASAVMRAMFPQDAARRAFLKSVGASTALAALAQFFPLKTATELFAQGAGALEKNKLKVGFIPITCATPIIMAHPMGIYAKHGLDVEVVKTAGWAIVRDKTINKEYDAAHMLSPMPLAISLGLGSQPVPFAVPAIENINGQGITLAIKHKDKRDPKTWKGFKFAIPFDYSNHNYLLRYYLAEHGIDPDNDVQLRSCRHRKWWPISEPTTSTAFSRPTTSVSVRSTTAWASCTSCRRRSGTDIRAALCGVSKEFITQTPNSYAALVRAIVDATAFASKARTASRSPRRSRRPTTSTSR